MITLFLSTNATAEIDRKKVYQSSNIEFIKHEYLTNKSYLLSYLLSDDTFKNLTTRGFTLCKFYTSL